MAVQINVAGKSTISVGTGSEGALETLGVALDMPRIVDRNYQHLVHGDLHGGPQGPPIDVQELGRVINVSLELSRYDRAIVQKLRKRLNQYSSGSDDGIVGDDEIGDLYFQGGYAIRVLVNNANDPYNFVQCLIADPIEISVGTKFTALIVNFEAHRRQSDGVIFDRTVV